MYFSTLPLSPVNIDCATKQMVHVSLATSMHMLFEAAKYLKI